MLAIIPAKLKSKRLPNKNLKLLLNEPLIAHTIKSALKSKKIKKIIVSTDSKKIAKIAIKYGAEVPFLRPAKLTKNKINTWDISKDVIKKLQIKENKTYESFIYLQPTSPLRTTQDIDNAIKKFKTKKANAVVSVSEAKPKFWFKNVSNQGKMSETKEDKKKHYLLNGAIFIFKTKFIQKSKANNYGKNCFAYVIPAEKAVDIDTLIDFKVAEFILKK